MRTAPLTVILLVGMSAVSLADVTQTKTLVSSGGVHSAAGNITMSSNLGEVIAGYSVNGSTDIWHGFYAPIPQQVVGVDGPAVSRIDYLASPAPNPTLTSAVVQYGLATRQSSVTLAVYDLGGRLVRRLVDGPQSPGVYRVTWDLRSDRGQSVHGGLYFIRLRTSSFSRATRLVVVR